MKDTLNPDRALIFRITHRENLRWILENGIHCRNSKKRDPEFVNIGNPELIDKRANRVIPCSPGGTLSDYVPFYFTPFSPMLLNIKTGYNGIKKRDNEEIVILVTSVSSLIKHEIPFLFTDRHAYVNTAKFYSNPDHLGRIDWTILQNRDFSRDIEDPGKVERYQAEALVHRRVPLHGLLGVVCYDDQTVNALNKAQKSAGSNLAIKKRSAWYF